MLAIWATTLARQSRRSMGVLTTRRRAVTLLFGAALLSATGACRDDDAIEVEEETIETAFASPEALEERLTSDGPLARRVAEYRLTPEGIARWSDAQRRLEETPSADTAMLRWIDQRVRARGLSDPVEIAVARLQGDTATRRAIRSADLSVREFVLTTLALYQAQLAAETDRPQLRALAGENVAFLTSRRGEVGTLNRDRVRYVIYDPDEDADTDEDTDRDEDTDTDTETDRETDTDEDTEKKDERRGRRDRGERRRP